MQARLTAGPQKGYVSSLGPSYPWLREVQQHFLAPWGEREPGSVNQATRQSRKGPCIPVLLQHRAVARGGQRHGTCCIGGGGRVIVFANTLIIPLPSTTSGNSCSWNNGIGLFGIHTYLRLIFQEKS